MKRKASKNMNYSVGDLSKVVVLIILLGLCLQSAFVKFLPAGQFSTISTATPSLPDYLYDYSTCKLVDNCDLCADKTKMFQQCKAEFLNKYKEADSKCQAYLKNLGICHNSQKFKQSQCHVELEHVEGCTKSVAKDMVDKWSKPQDVQQDK
jgi:hypothetical protein